MPNGVPGADCPWVNNQEWTVVTGGTYSVPADSSTTAGSLHAEPINQCFGSKIRFGKASQVSPYLGNIIAQSGVTEDYDENDPYHLFAVDPPDWQLGNVLNRTMWQQLQDTFTGLGILSQSVESWNPYTLTNNLGVQSGLAAETASAAWSSARGRVDEEDLVACGNLDEEDRESPSCALFHAGANLDSFPGGDVRAEIVLLGTHKVRLPSYFPENVTPICLLKYVFLNGKNTKAECFFKDNLGRRFSLPATAELSKTVKLFETASLVPSSERTFLTTWGQAAGADEDGPPNSCPLNEVVYESGEERESFIEAAKYGGQMALIHNADLMMDGSIVLEEDLVDPEEVWFPKEVSLNV
jgi:hypothetical protein